MKNEKESAEIGLRIRARREELGMSQEALAFAVGYKSRTSINKIELGKTDLLQSMVKKLALELYTTPGYIMGDDEISEKNKPAPYVGSGGISDLDKQIAELIMDLPLEKKQEAINYLRYLSELEEK